MKRRLERDDGQAEGVHETYLRTLDVGHVAAEMHNDALDLMLKAQARVRDAVKDDDEDALTRARETLEECKVAYETARGLVQDNWALSEAAHRDLRRADAERQARAMLRTTVVLAAATVALVIATAGLIVATLAA